MRSIKARFNNLYKGPRSSYIAFAGSIKKQRFTFDSISRNFSQLVEKNDYREEERVALLKELYLLSNPVEEHGMEVKKTPRKI